MSTESVAFEAPAPKFWWETSGTLYVHGEPDIVFDARPPDDAIPLLTDCGEQLKGALSSNFRQFGEIARLRAALQKIATTPCDGLKGCTDPDPLAGCGPCVARAALEDK